MTTRDRILSRAGECLADQDYASFTLAEVRDDLGLSNGSMFHAFPSKAALAAAVYVDGMADYQEVAVESLQRSDDAAQSVRDLIDAHLGWVQDHAALSRFLFSTLPSDVQHLVTGPLADRNAVFIDRLDEFYERVHAARLMGALPRALAHTLCIGAAQEYCRQWLRGNTDAPLRDMSPILGAASLAALASTVDVSETHLADNTGTAI